MFLDSLTQKELIKIISFIGEKGRSIKAGRILFPDRPKGYITVTRNIKNYCYNKYCAYEYFNERQKYIEVSSKIWCDLPVWARTIPDDILKGIFK